MTTLSLNAEKIHNELSIKNFIIKKQKWYKNPTYIYYFILFFLTISIFAFLKTSLVFYIFLIWGVCIAIVQFIIFHYINKLICNKYKIKLKKKGVLWIFPNIKYQKKNMKLFYKKMISKKMLFGNKKDIFLLELIEEDIANSMIKPITSYPLQIIIKKTWPIITALFITYVALFLTQSKDFIIDSKLIFTFTMLLLFFISQVLYCNYMIMDVLNSKYRKQQRFLKRITKLKTYLKLKYHSV